MDLNQGKENEHPLLCALGQTVTWQERAAGKLAQPTERGSGGTEK